MADVKFVERAYDLFSGTVYRVCMMYLKNPADAEDAVADIFLKLLSHTKAFNGDDHLKAWLIVAAKNRCKNALSHWWSKTRVEFDSIPELAAPAEDLMALAVEDLPEIYWEALYLYYYEGYSGQEASKMLGITESAFWSRLKRGREILKLEMEEECDERKRVQSGI
jgi:RNA polymerase sigma-70 factor (ECF subfamily)